jgi:hypothetical protein
MKVICAWCENEGKETLIGEIGLFDAEMTSHGICLDHEQVLIQQVNTLKLNHNPRLRRSRRSRAQSRQSGSAAVLNCARPWRRRKGRTPSAQLGLPFDDAGTHDEAVGQEVGLAPMQ